MDIMALLSPAEVPRVLLRAAGQTGLRSKRKGRRKVTVLQAVSATCMSVICSGVISRLALASALQFSRSQFKE
jgi:hypothetical protein